tara:strand:- start:138 stop:410 length:273 start_codon:yes stop_codon:yes gene_type:complete
MQGIDEKSAESFLDRNKTMWTLYKNGGTMEEIGAKFGITKQRVHQIIRRCKIGDGDYYGANSIENTQKMLDETDYADWLKTKGVKTIRNS